MGGMNGCKCRRGRWRAGITWKDEERGRVKGREREREGEGLRAEDRGQRAEGRVEGERGRGIKEKRDR